MFQNNSKGMKNRLKKTGLCYIYSFICLCVGANICLLCLQGVILKVLRIDLVPVLLESPVKLLLPQKDSIDVGCFFKRAEAFVMKNWGRLKENPVTEQNRVRTKCFP